MAPPSDHMIGAFVSASYYRRRHFMNPRAMHDLCIYLPPQRVRAQGKSSFPNPDTSDIARDQDNPWFIARCGDQADRSMQLRPNMSTYPYPYEYLQYMVPICVNLTSMVHHVTSFDLESALWRCTDPVSNGHKDLCLVALGLNRFFLKRVKVCRSDDFPLQHEGFSP